MRISMKTTGSIGVLAWLMFIIVCCYGYTNNILLLINSVSANNYNENLGMFILRIVGVFTGIIGVFMGFVS